MVGKPAETPKPVEAPKPQVSVTATPEGKPVFDREGRQEITIDGEVVKIDVTTR